MNIKKTITAITIKKAIKILNHWAKTPNSVFLMGKGEGLHGQRHSSDNDSPDETEDILKRVHTQIANQNSLTIP